MTSAMQPEPPLSRLAIWRSRVEYHGIILGVICTLITLILLIGASMTEKDIALRLAEDRAAILNQVIPSHRYDNEPLHERITVPHTATASNMIDVHIARHQGAVSAVAFQTVAAGYGGPISLLIGVDQTGAILGVRVLSHRETPGLADKIDITRSDWITAFDGRSLQNTEQSRWAVKKDGGDFDQFTGATITPRAIVSSVYDGLLFYARHQHTIAATTPTSQGSHAP